jgi:hypothetical protein
VTVFQRKRAFGLLLLLVALSAACVADDKKVTDAAPMVDAGPLPGPGPVSLGDSAPLAAACKGTTKPGITSPVPSFKKQVLVEQDGAAYIKPADLNNDGYPEFLLTTLAEGLDWESSPPISNGGAYVLARDGVPEDNKLGTWKTTKVFDRETKVEVEGGESTGIGFPNSSELLDVDNDGVKDWMLGAGFLIKPTGLLVWMKGERDGSFGAPRLIPVPDSTCWYHITMPLDMDDDGDEDFVTTCHIGDTKMIKGGSRTEWFENPGDDSGVFAHHAIGEGGGSLLTLFDVDGDGDQDVLLPQFFDAGALVWYEQTADKGDAWAKHLINESTGRGFITRLADMNGDGKVDIVYGNHNNEEAADPSHRTMGVYWFEVPPSEAVHGLTNWDAYLHTIYEGFEVHAAGKGDSMSAPGMLSVGDLDGDCDMDVLVSGDGDLGLYAFVQHADSFERVELSRDPKNENAGEQHMFDLNGDGKMDMIWCLYGIQAGPATMLESQVAAFLQQ